MTIAQIMYCQLIRPSFVAYLAETNFIPLCAVLKRTRIENVIALYNNDVTISTLHILRVCCISADVEITVMIMFAF